MLLIKRLGVKLFFSLSTNLCFVFNHKTIQNKNLFKNKKFIFINFMNYGWGVDNEV